MQKQPLIRELYKTGLCKSWERDGACPYGVRCIFAHGHEQLRPRPNAAAKPPGDKPGDKLDKPGDKLDKPYYNTTLGVRHMPTPIRLHRQRRLPVFQEITSW